MIQAGIWAVRAATLLMGTAVLAAPWFFGAWEMWWFWPWAGVIFLATLLLAGPLLGAMSSGSPAQRLQPDQPQQRRARLAGLLCLPFLAYAFVRLWQADVFADAERSFLLFLTPLLVGFHVAYGLAPGGRRRLFDLLVFDIALLGLYGIINHAVTGSARVLWRPGFEQYYLDGRASGTYFCPNHYAGIMEIGLALAMGLLLTRGLPRRDRAAGALLAVIALWSIVISRSRGASMTVVVMAAAALVWGFQQWRPALRWSLRAGLGAAALALLLAVWQFDSPYTQRFKSYFTVPEQTRGTSRSPTAALLTQLKQTSRGRMFGGALRAWTSAPFFGIGPGMHQNLWPQFAATADGDREAGIWPSQLNNNFHSYEVHSDWLQLLEEYGLVGLILFCIPAVAVPILLWRGVNRHARDRARAAGDRRHAMLLAALFTWTAMGFHSLGDFNLQMPATVWITAAVIAMGLASLPSRGRVKASNPEPPKGTSARHVQ